jgi:hypothetical protein
VQTVTDEHGNYGFPAVAPGGYEIEVKAIGLTGSHAVSVVSGAALDIPVQLKVEARKETVTVTAKEPAISKESSEEAVINRSTVLKAPNKYERFDALLPLIPGVLRGPDGFINMKGARSSQGGALLNSANVTDPATGNAAMNLPIDVVQSVKVVANPYDPEYGRLTGAVSSVETVTSNFNAFHLSVQNLFPRPWVRVIATAGRAAVDSVLVIWPEDVNTAILDSYTELPMLKNVRVEKLIWPSAFNPECAAHWVAIAVRLEDQFLWLPWNWVTHKRALTGLSSSRVLPLTWHSPAMLQKCAVVNQDGFR